MNRIFLKIGLLMLVCSFTASAQLAVTVSPPKIVGQKIVVALAMTNNLAETIESARAICFLMDESGKMVGQSAKWVIGENKTKLKPKSVATFSFVITSLETFATTNLTAKVSFSRVVMNDGKLADLSKDLAVTLPLKK